MKKKLTLVLALALAVCIGIGGTLAWLSATTNTITNTFTVGKVSIMLAEKNNADGSLLDATTLAQTQNFKVTPGMPVTKEAKVGVADDSEKSILYIKVTKGADFNTYFETTIDDTVWTKLESATGDNYEVYYLEQAAVPANTPGQNWPEYSILEDDIVTAKDNITTANLVAADVSLAFQAYAIQYDGLDGTTLLEKAVSGWDTLNS